MIYILYMHLGQQPKRIFEAKTFGEDICNLVLRSNMKGSNKSKINLLMH